MTGNSSFGQSIVWRHWGSESINAAQGADKPLWVTIYDDESPWSEAMKEAFLNEEVFQLLNDDFVPVLCHSQEFPDLTSMGQSLCRLFGTPGWPVNMVLSPHLEPLFAASWLAPETGGAAPALLDVVRRIKWLWVMKRPEMDSAAQTWQERLKESLASRRGEASKKWEALALSAVTDDADATYGGYGSAPKFPQWWRLLLASKEKEEQRQLERSLTALACSALQDHVRGGFHRYCRDQQWRVPLVGLHLDVQAMAALTMMKGWQGTGSPLYQRAALRCFEAIEDLTPQGELPRRGEAPWTVEQTWRQALWSPDEVASVLGDDASWYCDAMSITAEGTWTSPVTGEATGLSAPALGNLASVAQAQNWSLAELLARLDESHKKLKGYRGMQPPLLQSCVTTGSVALAALALARGGRLFEVPSLLVRSAQLMETLQEQLMKDEELLHGMSEGRFLGAATLGDWAACAAAALELAQGFNDSLWLGWADKMAHEGWSRFAGDGRLKLFTPSIEGLVECCDGSDGTSFSAPALLGLTIVRLAHCQGSDAGYIKAGEILSLNGASIEENPASHAGLLALWRSLENSGAEDLF